MNIVITGCSRGIGLELVKLFSQKHTVYCLSRNITPIEKYKEEIGGSDRIRIQEKLLLTFQFGPHQELNN